MSEKQRSDVIGVSPESEKKVRLLMSYVQPCLKVSEQLSKWLIL